LAKLATGIEGFDELSSGGLPRHAGHARGEEAGDRNLAAICQEYLQGGHKLEVVDVLETRVAR
jgi:hypothetical protein